MALAYEEKELSYRVSDKHKKDFVAACRKLNKVISEVRRYEPEANVYVEDTGNVYLMLGETHDDNRDACRESAAMWASVLGISGGGW